jgi:hypothetical protein
VRETPTLRRSTPYDRTCGALGIRKDLGPTDAGSAVDTPRAALVTVTKVDDL